MTSPYHMLELLLQVDNDRIRYGSIRKQTMYGGGDWEFQLRRSRIDSFSREEFDEYCLNIWKDGHFISGRDQNSQNSQKLGNLQDWYALNSYIPMFTKDKKGKIHYDFLEKYIALKKTYDWRIIHNDGNLCQITCQDATFYYLLSFGTT